MKNCHVIVLLSAILFIATSICPAEGLPVLLKNQGCIQWSEIPAKGRIGAADPASDVAVTAALEQILAAQIAGPGSKEKSEGLESLFPSGCRVDRLEVTGGNVTILLDFPEKYLKAAIDDLEVEFFAKWMEGIARGVEGVKSIALKAKVPGASEYLPLPSFLPPPPTAPDKIPAEKSETSLKRAGQPPSPGQAQPTGALTGASIFLSPGHGWYWNTTSSRWVTQRGNTYNICEDHSNAESVFQNLCQYLWNAGARVYSCRERDLNSNQVIVDNGDPGFSVTGTWPTSTYTGSWYGTNYQYHDVSLTETATARWTPNIPEAGFYCVYIWWPYSSTRSTDAKYTIYHTGGSTEWIQNQTRDSSTWKCIGSYYFETGSNPATGSVILSDQGTNTSSHVVADAVRFGGGMGSLADPSGGGISGEPRWEESGRYYRVFMGNNVWSGTVSAMPSYADWECEDSWEGNGGTPDNDNAIYVSWHTNAYNGSVRGTSSFAYASGGWHQPFDGVPGGLELRNLIHAELMNDLDKGWESGWRDAGKTTAWFGEINPSYNNDMPASLHEIAFHDNASDANCIKDPNFRRIAARAVYQGIVKFYNQYFYSVKGNSEFDDDTLLPEPPTNLRVYNNGTGGAIVEWDAPSYDTGDGLIGDAAAGYRVYMSTHGKGFDNGVTVSGATQKEFTGLTVGNVYYFRVTATNDGGESFPTETLALRIRASGRPPVLIVSGFDRIDRHMNVVEGYYGGGDLHRGYLWKMNTYDYVIQHAKALAAAQWPPPGYGNTGIDFDSASNEAVIDSQVNLTDYYAVIWFTGEDAIYDNTFDTSEQSLVQSYLTGGGHLFVSGAEIGWDLDFYNNGRSFYEDYIHADYNADDAGIYSASGETGTIFEGVSLNFDDGTYIYDANYPDVILSKGGSQIAMSYGGAGGTSTRIDEFEEIGGWWDPNSSGQTNAHADSSFDIETTDTIVLNGNGCGELYYRWDTGNHIREYNADQPAFPVNSTFSIWVRGDNSGHQVRFNIRDTDVDIFGTDYETINFTGWQKFSYNTQTDFSNNWHTPGNGTLDGPDVAFDSIEVHKVASQDTGTLYFDDAYYTTTGSGGAGIQYTDSSYGYKIVYLGFPFETIVDESDRGDVMQKVMDFFNVAAVPVELSVFNME